MVILQKRIRYDFQKLKEDIFERFHHQETPPDSISLPLNDTLNHSLML
jgi:hypothetical protein